MCQRNDINSEQRAATHTPTRKHKITTCLVFTRFVFKDVHNKNEKYGKQKFRFAHESWTHFDTVSLECYILCTRHWIENPNRSVKHQHKANLLFKIENVKFEQTWPRPIAMLSEGKNEYLNVSVINETQVVHWWTDHGASTMATTIRMMEVTIVCAHLWCLHRLEEPCVTLTIFAHRSRHTRIDR